MLYSGVRSFSLCMTLCRYIVASFPGLSPRLLSLVVLPLFILQAIKAGNEARYIAHVSISDSAPQSLHYFDLWSHSQLQGFSQRDKGGVAHPPFLVSIPLMWSRNAGRMNLSIAAVILMTLPPSFL